MDEELGSRYRRSRNYLDTGPVARKRAPVKRVVADDELPASPIKPQPVHRRPKSRIRYKKWLVIIVFGLIVLIALGLAARFGLKTKQNHDIAQKNRQTTAAKKTFPGISFPIYYPSNLPAGYTFNDDAKVLQNNVLYYSVTDTEGLKYYVTLQPIPAAFNYATFNDKFLKPHQYTTKIGSVVAGQVGANLIASIQTSDNVWILINADSKNSQTSLEAITRSFDQAQ